MKIITILLIILAVISCNQHQESKTEFVSETLDNKIYKKYNLQNSNAVVLDAFSESDVVILGENHFIKEHVLFVADLIPKLYNDSIYTMYSEFTYLVDSLLVDSLIFADNFDEKLAKELLVRSGWEWQYKEYIELYHSAWTLNSTIKEGRKFRIIGLELGRDYTAIQKLEDWKDTEKRMAYFREYEDDWANRIISNTINKGEKALVYCGIYHGLTFYKQPVSNNGIFIRLAGVERMGQYLYQQHKDNCKFIVFHFPWEQKNNRYEAPVVPLKGKLDQIADRLSEPYKSYGFYTQKSSLAKIKDTMSYFSYGYPNFSLSSLCDAYLVIKPLCELNQCEAVPNFIDASNIDIVRPQVKAWLNIKNISIDSANQILSNDYKELTEFFNKNKKSLNCN